MTEYPPKFEIPGKSNLPPKPKEEIVAVSSIDLRQIRPAAEIAKSIKDIVMDGQVDVAKAGVYIKRLAKVTEILSEDKELKEYITDETKKYMTNGKNAVVDNASISYQATYTWYDFNECGHPVLESLYLIKKEVDAKIKEIEEELKLLIPKGNKDITPNLNASSSTSIEELEFDLGIKKKTKPIIITEEPRLIWQNSGETVEVSAPIKKQSMGLKYLKV